MLEVRNLTMSSVVMRVFIAIFLGGIIGMDRGLKNRPAGVRTYMLVSIGSCVAMMLNQYTFWAYGIGDPVRLGAQVISGIGFLCAGTILVTTHNQVRGLTTAAGLWASGCIGLAVGIGFYEAAAVAAAAVFGVMTVLHRLDMRMHSRLRIVDLYIELEPEGSPGSLLRSCRAQGLEVSNLQWENGSLPGENRNLTVTVRGRGHMNAERIILAVNGMDGVRFAQRL